MTFNLLRSETDFVDDSSAVRRSAGSSLRVLIVAYHFPPSAASGAFRLLGFSRHLPKFGWRVAVVAPSRIPWEPYDAALGERVPEETAVFRVPYPSGLWSKPARRVAPYAAWLVSAWPACLRAVRQFRPHVVLTSGPPHCVHALGMRLRRRFGLTWFADFRDPWITNGQPTGQRSLKNRWLLRWERDVMRHADAVLLNAPRACQIIQAAYPEEAEKMLTVTNGFDPEAFDEDEADETTPGGRRSILHTGELYAGRDPRPLLDALESLVAEQPGIGERWQLRLVGQVTAKFFEANFDLQGEIRRRGLADMIELAGQLPYGRTLRAMRAADILLLIDSPGRRMGVPAKLYEYLGAGRPVLALAETDGDTAWVLRRSGSEYRLAPPDDARGIRQALGELLAIATGGHGAAPSSSACDFSRESIAGHLADVMRRAVQPAERDIRMPAGV